MIGYRQGGPNLFMNRERDWFLDLPKKQQQLLANSFKKLFTVLKIYWESRPENVGKTITYGELWEDYMNNSRIRFALLSRLKEISQNSHISLPEYIDFERSNLDLSVIRMHIGTHKVKGEECACVTDNMQQDSAAFEGWALVIKTRLPEVRKIELSWAVPSDKHNRHYQRFLYRVHKFEQFFSEWFSVMQSVRDALRIDFNRRGAYTLNVPDKKRDGGDAEGNGERAIEQRFIQKGPLRASLQETASLDVMGNQLPVGLFEGKVSGKRENAIFTRQASAIDLWGVDEQRRILSVFELKLEENAKVGVLSELFFYAMVMRDLTKGLFVFDEKRIEEVDPWPSDYITEGIPLIRAYALSPKLHSLINREVFEMMTAAIKKEGVVFDRLSYDLERKICFRWPGDPEVAH